MCTKLFGKSSGGILGDIGETLGGIGGFFLGGPAGAALGAEAGGTLGGVVGGEKLGQAAEAALPGAALAGVGGFGAEALGATPATSIGGSDLFGVSGTDLFGTAAAPSATSAAGADLSGGFGSTIAPDGSTIAGYDTTTLLDPNAPTTPYSAFGDTTATPGAATPGGGGGFGSTLTPGGDVMVGGLGGTPTGAVPIGAASGTSGGGILSNVANTLGISKSSILPAAVAGGGLITNIARGSNLQGQSQLTGLAAQTAQQSAIMENYLNTGTLPPGVQTAVNNATAGAKAAIRSKYAASGLSGSSMEQQELSQVDLNAAAAGSQVAINLYSQGLDDAKISEGIYNTLLSTDVKQQELTSNAIANMAAALSGGGTYQRQQPQPVA